jgi:hypothetical protein
MSRIRHTHYQPVGFSQICDPVPDLFALPAQPVDTSLAAAEGMREAAPSIRERIARYIQARGSYGATAEDVCLALDLNPSTVRPRLLELEGRAKWAKGKLRARIVKTPQQRNGMRIYRAL